MTTPSPLHIASSAQQMARLAPAENAMVFHKVSMVCMGVMAAASVLQALQPLLRERGRDHGDADRGGRGR